MIDKGKNVRPTVLSEAQIAYVDFCAVDGLQLTEGGGWHQMSQKEFADKIQVSRSTLYNWQKIIPNFWGLVRERRKVLFGGKRESAVWKGVLLRASRGEHKQAEMFLSHFADYQPPTQRQEIDVRGFADLARAALQKKVYDESEAELVSRRDDTGTSSQDTAAHSETA